MVKNPPANAGDAGLTSRSGRFPGGEWQPIPVFLPEKFHGQKSLAGYSPWDCNELETTEQLSTHAHNRFKCDYSLKFIHFTPMVCILDKFLHMCIIRHVQCFS